MQCFFVFLFHFDLLYVSQSDLVSAIMHCQLNESPSSLTPKYTKLVKSHV